MVANLTIEVALDAAMRELRSGHLPRARQLYETVLRHHPDNEDALQYLGAIAFGLFGVLPVSLAELSAGGACPHLGVLPACHLVSLAYGTVLLTVLHRRLWNPWVFLLAWLPIFALAATVSGLELLGHGTCPKTESGLPKCFFSLGLAVALLMPFLVHFSKSMRISAQRS